MMLRQDHNVQVNSGSDISSDLERMGRISIIPLILKIVAHTTEMGFVAVARVTTEKWVACDVYDRVKFGLIAGGELVLDTTICHEIRHSGNAVVIDDVANDEIYRTHHTPAMYGFKSYISVPIKQVDGEFYGTLCAIDPNTALLSTPYVVEMIRSFASLISFHLNAVDNLSLQQNEQLEKHSAALLQHHFADFLEPIPVKNNDPLLNENNNVGQVSINTKNEKFATAIRESAGKIAGLLHELQELQASHK